MRHKCERIDTKKKVKEEKPLSHIATDAIVAITSRIFNFYPKHKCWCSVHFCFFLFPLSLNSLNFCVHFVFDEIYKLHLPRSATLLFTHEVTPAGDKRERNNNT